MVISTSHHLTNSQVEQISRRETNSELNTLNNPTFGIEIDQVSLQPLPGFLGNKIG